MDHRVKSKNSIPFGTLISGFLQIGEAIIDCGASRVINREPQVRFTPKVLAVLVELARQQGETVSRDMLLDTVWSDTNPTPDIVKQAVSEIRRAFDASGCKEPVIETIPRLGYRLVVSAKYGETLQEILQQSEHHTDVNHSIQPLDAQAIHEGKAKRVYSALTALVVIFFAVMLFGLLRKDYFVTSNEMAVSKPLTYQLLTSDVGAERFPSISPDGKMIAYSYNKELEGNAPLVTRVVNDHGIEVREFSPDRNGSFFSFPVWSHDGTEIALQVVNDKKASCEIKAFPVSGGPGRLLSQCWADLLQHFDWSPDGRSLSYSGMPGKAHSPLGKIYEYSVQSEKYLSPIYGDSRSHVDLEPKYSPDGKSVLFRRGVQPNTDLFLLNVAEKSARQLTNFGGSLRGYDWTADGKFVVFSSNHLGVYALYALRLTDGVVIPLGVEDAQYPSVSSKARVIVFQKTRIKTEISKVSLVEANLKPLAVMSATTASDRWARVSPLNQSLAFISNRSGVDQVWITLDGEKAPYKLTRFSGERLESLSWSTDGKKLLVVAISQTSSKAFEIDVERQKLYAIELSRNLFVQSIAYGMSADNFIMTAREGGSSLGIWQGSRSAGSESVYVTKMIDDAKAFSVARQGFMQIWAIKEPDKPIEIYDRNFSLIRKIQLKGSISTLKHGENGLWYIALNEGNTELRRYSVSTNSDVSVSALESYSWVNSHFDISADGKNIYYTRTVQDDSDIALAELPSTVR